MITNSKHRDAEDKEYRIDRINWCISDLVYEKKAVKRAYNYYHGRMDTEQYQHLEENYGIGTPTQLKFYPLIKKHIDALVGKFLELPLNLLIACKDKGTLSNIFREKQLAILEATREEYLKDLYSKVLVKFGTPDNIIPKDPLTEESIQALQEELDKNFVSEYEITAQNVIMYLTQSRNIDFDNKTRMLFTDLLITGTVYFKCHPSESGENVDVEQLSPLDTFVEKNPNSYYLKDCPRAVCRYKRTLEQILMLYGNYLSAEDKDKLRNSMRYHGTEDSKDYAVHSAVPMSSLKTEQYSYGSGILGGYEVTPEIGDNEEVSTTTQHWEWCYEVEYIEADDDGKQHRYSGVRIGEDLYILYPVDKDVVRSKDNPKKCELSVNGLFMTTRQNHPFSLVLATADLQDLYNVLFFHRENLIDTSGTKGAWVDFSQIPVWLDEDEVTRFLKWQGYRKQGIGLIDTAQNEPGSPPINTIYNGFDDTLSLNAIQAIDLTIERVEQAASNITGVFREMIGGIEQKDAVHNVKVGIDQSFIVTKTYYANMNLVLKEMLLDALNVAKGVYKKGITGTLILGEKRVKIFTALPEHFTLSDHDIHIADGQEAIRNIEDMKAMNLELIKSGQIDPEIMIEATGCKSITDYKSRTLKALRLKKQEMNQMQQLATQTQQYEQQLQQMQQQLQQIQQQNQQLTQQLEKAKVDEEKLKVEWYKAQEDNERKKEANEVDKKKVDVEIAQMFDNNPYNNEVNHNT